FKEIDEILLESEQEFKEIEEISQRLKDYSQKIQILEKFYFNKNWQKDRDELIKQKQDDFYSTSEDGIWNLLVAYREERIK
ncbi:MAG: hypothetical protein CSA15_13385, partial [Candidatus Delongbacteria bacterium]